MQLVGTNNAIDNKYKNPENIDSGFPDTRLDEALEVTNDNIDTMSDQIDTLNAQMIIVDNNIDDLGDQITALENNFPVVSVSGTSKTLALSDRNTLQLVNNAATITITVPPNASVAFPYDGATIINFTQVGAGQITIAPGSGVTINSYLSKLSTAGQYASCSLTYTSLNVWYLTGALI